MNSIAHWTCNYEKTEVFLDLGEAELTEDGHCGGWQEVRSVQMKDD